MAAPIGNQFWKLRSKHGRDKLFATPDLLWEAACEYFQWCDDHPWVVTKNRSKMSGPEIEETPTQQPYTLRGLCLYLDVCESFWRKFKDGGHDNFFTVITRIEGIIENQQFAGAVVGAFNANIIARKLGLADKRDLTSGGDKIAISPLNDLPLDKLLEIQKIINESDNI